jgi:hypothetical protein
MNARLVVVHHEAASLSAWFSLLARHEWPVVFRFRATFYGAFRLQVI